MSQLDQIIASLKNKPEIEAVFIAGSQGHNSDIDLGIVMNTGTDIKSLFQWVDNKPCEVHFFNIDEIKSILEKDSISPNDQEGLIASFLERADIKFDHTGTLTSYKNNYAQVASKLRVPEGKKIWFSGVVNWAYVTNRRYYESNVPAYLEALELKLPADLNLLLKAYFEFRDIPWKGEKRVAEYLKTNDIDFYNTYMSCLRASSVKETYEMYSKLVNLVFYGNYRLWDKGIIYPSAKLNPSPEGIERLIEYWKKLTA